MDGDEMRSATGVREPLSKTITSRGGSVCAAIESRQARSMSPPSMSRMMTETSVMLHPVEVRAAVEATELGASARAEGNRRVTILRAGGRNDERVSAHFD